MSGLVRVRAGVSAGHKNVDSGRGQPKELLVLCCDLALRSAQKALTKTETDGQLPHTRLARQIREDLVKSHIKVYELQRSAGIDSDLCARCDSTRPLGVESLLAFRRRKNRTVDIDFFDLRQRRPDVVLSPKRHKVGIERESVDQNRNSLALSGHGEVIGVVRFENLSDQVRRCVGDVFRMTPYGHSV